MTEWMFQDVCDVEEWYVCSSSSHQARCDVALDMGHLWPAGHKWAQGSSHDDKWVWTGCYAGAVPAGRAGRCQCCFLRIACPRGVLAFGAAGATRTSTPQWRRPLSFECRRSGVESSGDWNGAHTERIQCKQVT